MPEVHKIWRVVCVHFYKPSKIHKRSMALSALLTSDEGDKTFTIEVLNALQIRSFYPIMRLSLNLPVKLYLAMPLK